jgi:hypothetical protein
VAAFTAEHVGRPNMLIVLYEDLIHADLEPVPLTQLSERNAGLSSFVVWDRDGSISSTLPAGRKHDDTAGELGWFEARMWTWSWYIQAKLLRGELYDVLDGLQYVRTTSCSDCSRAIAASSPVVRAGSNSAWARGRIGSRRRSPP